VHCIYAKTVDFSSFIFSVRGSPNVGPDPVRPVRYDGQSEIEFEPEVWI
jgi:hypothetical protein